MPRLSWDLITRYRPGGLDDFADDLDGAEDDAHSAGKGIAKALGAAGLAGGAALAAGFAMNASLEVGNDKLAAQLGLTTEEADKAGKAAAEVYGDNWGENMDEVNEAIRFVGTNLGDLGKVSEKELQGMTEDALALSKTFDVDLAGSTEAAGSLIKNGLAKDATQAFDLITAGMQGGLNKADDLLDTITEYSPQFAKLGFNGEQALGAISQFLDAGARDSDVAADAFKEFGLRAIDGSKTTIDAYKSLGLNGKQMGKDIAKGGGTAIDSMASLIEELKAVKDPVEQNRIGTELFGTTWEDTVRSILPNLDLTKKGLQDVDGATAKMADTVGDNAQGKIDTFKRSIEQWTQRMASSDGQLGLLVTGLGTFGGGAVETGSQLGIMAVAFKGTAAAELVTAGATKVLAGGLKLLRAAWVLALGPVGAIVAGLALLAAGLIYAYKHSEKFKAVVDTVFRFVADKLLWLVDKWLGAWQIMFDVLGKLPGKFGAPFRAASKSVQGLRDKVNGLRRDINSVHGKTVKLSVITEYHTTGSAGPNGHATGAGSGRTTNAEGGNLFAGVSSLVGEHGPEISLAGTDRTIIPAGLTAAIRGGGQGATYVTVNVHGNALASKRELKDLILGAIQSGPAGGTAAGAARNTARAGAGAAGAARRVSAPKQAAKRNASSAVADILSGF